jgi:hypothetical protein
MNRTCIFGLVASSFACAAMPERLPVVFEPNSGQAPGPVKYVSESEGRKLWLTRHGATVRTATGSLGIGFAGAREVTPEPESALPGFTNVITGSDPHKWRSGVPHYARVRYRQLYDGIDLAFHSSDDRELEYDFEVAPYANASHIRIRFDGMRSARLTLEGELVFDLGGSTIRQPAPKAFQEGVPVGVRYVQLSRDTFGFHIAPHDAAKPLLIDPIVEYAGFVSTNKRDFANWTAVDSAGRLYLAGTYAEPGVQYLQGISVSKVNADGSTVLFTTRIPTNGLIGVTQAALDGAGGLFVVGFSQATNLPVTGGGSSHSGDTDGYLLHLNSEGVVTYGTYVGGAGSDGLDAIFRLPSGALYLAGYSNSAQYRGTANPFAPRYAVVVLRAGASGSIESTRLLEPGFFVKAIAVDAASNVVLVGATATDGMRHDGVWPLRRTGGDTNADAYIRRYDAAWNLTFGAYYGGSQTEDVAGVAFEHITGDVLLTGYTHSSDLPLEKPWQGVFDGGQAFVNRDGYVARISLATKSLVYATYLGGYGVDTPTGIAVDHQQNAYVAGIAGSLDFPIVGSSLLSTPNGAAFITKLSPAGQVLASTAVGSTHSTVTVAVDSALKPYVVGFSHYAGVTNTMPGAQPQDVDTAFFAKLNLDCHLTFSPAAVDVPQQGGEFTISITGTSQACPVRVTSRDWFIQVRESSATSARVYVPPLNSSSLRGGGLDISGYVINFVQEGNSTGAPDTGIVDPISTVAAEQAITARYGSWYVQIASAYIMVNSEATGANGCVIEYQSAGNQFRLLSKDGTQWLGPAQAKSTVVLRNGLCSLHLKNSFATRRSVGDMHSVAVSVRVQFDSAFQGPKQVFTMAAAPDGKASGWIPSASLTVPFVASLPGLESLSPLASGSLENTFTAVFTHGGGASQHYLGYTLILPTPNVVSYTAKGSCLVEYNAISNGIRLVDDAGTAWLGPVSGVPIKAGAQSLSNAVCTVNVAGAVAQIDGSRMTISVPVSLKPAGAKGLLATFLQAFDVTGAYTGMTQFGTVFVGGTPAPGPQILNAGPNVGSGTSVTLGGIVSAPDAAMIHARVGSSIIDSNACHVIYFPSEHTMNLVADSGASLVAGLNMGVGQPGVLANSRCALNVGAAAVVKTGTQFSLSIPLTFQTATFGGPKYFLWNAFDIRGLTSHWVFGGSWDVR